jgi:hypothetical protein
MHGHMARSGHGLPKVSPGPAMSDPFTPCLTFISGVVHPQGQRPAAVYYPIRHPTLHPTLHAYGYGYGYAYGVWTSLKDTLGEFL